MIIPFFDCIFCYKTFQNFRILVQFYFNWLHTSYIKTPNNMTKRKPSKNSQKLMSTTKVTSQRFLFHTLVVDVHHFSISKDQERKNEMQTLTMVMMMIMMMKKKKLTINQNPTTNLLKRCTKTHT